MLHWLPESPRVLLLRGEVEQAKDVYRVIYKDASEEIIDLKMMVTQHYIEMTTKLQMEYTFAQRVRKYWTHLPYRRAIIAVSGVQAFGQLTG